VPEGKPAHDPCWKCGAQMASKKSGGEQPLAEVKFLTVAEVATAMRVSKTTVYRLVHSGELPAVRVGRSFRVSEDAVHDYLKGAFFQAG
jgi:excisionase family DNA binding protein